ncbi:MAG: hypothetical protein AVDCRST_MAG50-294 [uncultured Acidimicrobiales bacterium]|uniref:1,4-dihydroxy-2-naphthoate polyprenyltransferase n=1 Tax=uncultured Acidimicrobiales bacterium TaxID=310071 RepID=A0A6J4H7P1_9ACTN|nr:MAG: hypothetical protein AVDCRST_MAG50-294 [uncultured Acidimicrobiales bacterium]
MVALLRASHLQPTLAVTLIATALAVAAGRGAGSVWVCLAVLAGQLSVGWSNDYVDRHRDGIAGRLDKPIPSGRVPAALVRTSAAAAALACVPLSLLSGWRAGFVHLGAVGVAWSYNIWLKSTVASVLAYALAFGALPAFVSLGLPGRPWPPAWSVVAAGLLGSGAHFVNTLPDLAEDERTGVRGLPHRIGPRRSLFLGAGLLATATLVLAIAPAAPLDLLGTMLVVVSLGAVLGVIVTASTARPRAAWTLTLCAAGLSVSAFLASGTELAG